ncbi:MAG TPA: hypothetical protein VKN64_10890 [Halanaerobiales bacterium]|nr:hypothetical protein [Halanaerobiales bacterium]
MAGSLTNAGETLALNTVFRGTDDIYVGLATSTITETDDLATIIEEDDANYIRELITFTAPADDGTGVFKIENDSLVEFPAFSSDADNNITYAFITKEASATSGDIIAFADLGSGKLPGAGDKLFIPAGGLSISLD